jgi:hypothetical protein
MPLGGALRFGLVVIGLFLDHLFVLRVVTESVPRIKQFERLATIEVAPNFWRATAKSPGKDRPSQKCSTYPIDYALLGALHCRRRTLDRKRLVKKTPLYAPMSWRN